MYGIGSEVLSTSPSQEQFLVHLAYTFFPDQRQTRSAQQKTSQLLPTNSSHLATHITRMTPPPKQASPAKTRTPSPTNDAGTAGLTSAYQETQTISSEIEPDESVSDEGYAESSSTSYVSSIASDVRRGIEENGRLYAAYGKHKPWVPVDDAEVFGFS
jgi:hypothetical protein